MKQFLQNLGLEGWIFGISGLAAILLSIINFLGFSFPLQQFLQILTSAVGMLMLAVVTNNVQHRKDIQNLRDRLGIYETQLLDIGEEFGKHLVSSLSKTKLTVNTTLLSSATPKLGKDYGFSGYQEEYQGLLFHRVSKREVSYRYVTVIYNEQKLEDMLFKLLLYEGTKFYLRHYDAPETPIPVLNIIGFDEELYYLGGFNVRNTARESKALFLNDLNTKNLLRNYWDILWEGSKPLNEGGIINWVELKRIGKKFGIDDAQFDKIVVEVKDQVRIRKKQLHSRR